MNAMILNRRRGENGGLKVNQNLESASRNEPL